MRELKTPSLVLDLTRVERNAKRMSEKALATDVRLRPHIKTHKCIEVARIQTAGHDGAITVSTLAEARAFAKHEFTDITYAVPIERGKFDDAIEILNSGVKLNLLTDDAETVKALDATGAKFDVFLKIDCGTHRVGVEPNAEQALTIPRLIADSSNLRFAGILTHAGHSYDVDSREAIRRVANHERDVMVSLSGVLRADGIGVPTVSVGSTPTMSTIDDLTGVDEIRPGNYIFFDNFQATLGSCSFEDTALTVLAAVIHKGNGRLVIDAGAIALSKDRGPVGIDPGCGYGRVLDIDGNETGMRVTGLSQEHGEISASDDAFERFKVGDRVRVLANHSCLTAAQHSHYNVIENGEIVDRWEIHRGW
jgi:D-serine deaminase-like pyridoxal phosphate-dependent protein